MLVADLLIDLRSIGLWHLRSSLAATHRAKFEKHDGAGLAVCNRHAECCQDSSENQQPSQREPLTAVTPNHVFSRPVVGTLTKARSTVTHRLCTIARLHLPLAKRMKPVKEAQSKQPRQRNVAPETKKPCGDCGSYVTIRATSGRTRHGTR